MPHFEMNNFDFSSTSDIVSLVGQTALEGDKVPHRTSQPVLRMHNGKLCLATFVFFFNKQHLDTQRIPRPSMWVVSDLKSGVITQRYDCKDNEFSFGGYDRLYDLASSGEVKADRQYLADMYALMDTIREMYLSDGQLRTDLYQEYMNRLYRTIPAEYQVFYNDLSNISL